MRITCNVTKSSSNVLLKSHVHTNTHTQSPHTYTKPNRQRRFYPSMQTTETAPSDRYKFSRVPRICFGSEYNVPTTTIPAPPYQNDNFSIISDSLACFLIVNKIRLSVSASFPFFSRGGKEMKWFLFWKMRVKFLVYICINWTQTG